ncbi:translation initiation factor IF-2-like [Meles meles]|uniref:translation initiation factor IF-2-like n=1 Tax=Meles meles TaxID=9662 RepID=UPI001E69CC9C|nr:translation initiation factor IF-2-like [Meles meles]
MTIPQQVHVRGMQMAKPYTGALLCTSARPGYTYAPAHDRGILIYQCTTGAHLCTSARPGHTYALSVPPEKTAQIWEERRSLARTTESFHGPCGLSARQCPQAGVPADRLSADEEPAFPQESAGPARGQRTESSGPGQSRGSRRPDCPRLPRAQGPAYSGRNNRVPPRKASGPLPPPRADPRGDPAAADALAPPGGARFPGRRERNRGARARTSLPAARRGPSRLRGLPNGSRAVAGGREQSTGLWSCGRSCGGAGGPGSRRPPEAVKAVPPDRGYRTPRRRIRSMRTPAGAASMNPLLRDFRAAGGRAEGRAGGVARGARCANGGVDWFVGGPEPLSPAAGSAAHSLVHSQNGSIRLFFPGARESAPGGARGPGTRLGPRVSPRFGRHLTASPLHSCTGRRRPPRPPQGPRLRAPAPGAAVALGRVRAGSLFGRGRSRVLAGAGRPGRSFGASRVWGPGFAPHRLPRLGPSGTRPAAQRGPRPFLAESRLNDSKGKEFVDPDQSFGSRCGPRAADPPAWDGLERARRSTLGGGDVTGPLHRATV